MSRPRAPLGLALVGLLGVFGCSPAKSPGAAAPGDRAATVVRPQVAVAPTSGADPGAVAVGFPASPSGFALDGDLAEWGDSAIAVAGTPPGMPLLPTVTAFGVTSVEELEARVSHGTNPENPGSFVLVAVSPEGARVALDLGGPAASGVWLGWGSAPPEVPPIGEYTRGGGFDAMECTANRQDYNEGSRYDTGEPNPPEVIAACKALLARHALLRETHDAHFARWLRIDEAGVQMATPGGALAPLTGAQVVWKRRGDRATAEVALPLAAFPRLSEAPLATLEVLARPISPAPPTVARDRWVRLGLPSPVAFEPLAELRARLFAPPEVEDEEARSMAYAPPLGLSYHPDDPGHVDSLRWADGTSSVLPQTETLYAPKTSLGDLEIGDVSAANRYVAVFRGGRLVDLIPQYGQRRTLIARHGEIHVISYFPSEYVMALGLFTAPAWSAVAIGPDGTRRDAVSDLGEDAPFCARYEDVTEQASRSFDTLGYRGTCLDYVQPSKIEATWRWHEASGMYRGTIKKH